MATYINMNHKAANKFKMVQIEDRLRFNKLLEENKNIVPCSLYVNKDNGTIYFIEEQTGPVLDLCMRYDEDITINNDIGLHIGSYLGI